MFSGNNDLLVKQIASIQQVLDNLKLDELKDQVEFLQESSDEAMKRFEQLDQDYKHDIKDLIKFTQQEQVDRRRLRGDFTNEVQSIKT